MVCHYSSELVSREVCTYPYQQNTVRAALQSMAYSLMFQATAVTQLTGVGLEVHSKIFEISRCHVYTEKGKDGEKEVEKCRTDSVEKEYQLPTVEEGVEDLIELNIPQPQKECRVFKFSIPEVICKVFLFFSVKRLTR